MTVQIAMVFHLIAVVRITIFAKARAVTLENVNLIAQVQHRHFFGKPRAVFPLFHFLFSSENLKRYLVFVFVLDQRKRSGMAGELLKRKRKSH